MATLYPVVPSDGTGLFVNMARTTESAFAVDARRRIVFWNAGATAMLGYTPEEVIGRNCCELLKERGSLACARCGSAERDTGEVVERCELGLRRRDGMRVGATVVLLQARSASGEPRLMHVVRPLTLEQDVLPSPAPGEAGAAKSALAAPGTAPLTRREHEVLQLLARGLSTAELAAALHISPLTARNHIGSVLEKLGVKTRLQAVVLATSNGLLAPR